MPDWWETFIGTNAKSASGDVSESNADRDDDGYTNLEEYLEWMATPHMEAAVGKTVTFNMADLTRGYVSSPSWKAGTSSCADLAVKDSTLSITPKSTCGVTYLSFTVTDKEGSTKTRKLGLFVTGSVSTSVALAVRAAGVEDRERSLRVLRAVRGASLGPRRLRTSGTVDRSGCRPVVLDSRGQGPHARRDLRGRGCPH